MSDCRCCMVEPPPKLKLPSPVPTTPETGVGNGSGDCLSLVDDPGAGESKVRMFEISGSLVLLDAGTPAAAPELELEPGGVGIFEGFELLLLGPNPVGVLEFCDRGK